MNSYYVHYEVRVPGRILVQAEDYQKAVDEVRFNTAHADLVADGDIGDGSVEIELAYPNTPPMEDDDG